MNRTLRALTLAGGCLALALPFGTDTLWADTAFQPGQKVVVGSGSMAEVGIVVRQDEHGVLVRFPMWDKRDDPDNGPTRYADPKDVRLQGATNAPPAPTAGPARPAPAAPAGAPTRRVSVPPAAGGAPLSQAEILGFLKARIGSNPWSHPDKPKVIQELSALIRARGVDFRMDTLSKFADELRNGGGNESTIPFHIRANFGPPVAEGWFFGAWDLTKYARSTSQQGDKWVERDTVAKNGQLRINPDHTYVWNSASGEFRGRWRLAVESEMAWRQAGGAGLVLEKGKSGVDWLVKEWDPEPLAVESISITLLDNESTQEFGGRR
jgi:hypothetical protein